MTQYIEPVIEEVLAEIEARSDESAKWYVVDRSWGNKSILTTDGDVTVIGDHIPETVDDIMAMRDDRCALVAEIRALRARVAEHEAEREDAIMENKVSDEYDYQDPLPGQTPQLLVVPSPKPKALRTGNVRYYNRSREVRPCKIC